MADLSFGRLQGKLMAAEKYSAIDAAILTEAVIDKFDEEVRTLVLDWVEGKDISSSEVDGTAVEDIVEAIDCSVFQALCILNAVKEKPDCFESAVFQLTMDSVLEDDAL